MPSFYREQLEGKFQSTPPAEARGDDSSYLTETTASVSIHSPRRSEGRLTMGDVIQPRSRFQSHSPRRSEGRLMISTPWISGSKSFNPLPPPKRGETSLDGPISS